MDDRPDERGKTFKRGMGALIEIESQIKKEY